MEAVPDFFITFELSIKSWINILPLSTVPRILFLYFYRRNVILKFLKNLIKILCQNPGLTHHSLLKLKERVSELSSTICMIVLNKFIQIGYQDVLLAPFKIGFKIILQLLKEWFLWRTSQEVSDGIGPGNHSSWLADCFKGILEEILILWVGDLEHEVFHLLDFLGF